MQNYDVVVLTDSRFLNQEHPEQYVQNVLLEDRLVMEALQRKGLKVTRRDWADPSFEWNSAEALLFRTTWDYTYRREEFYSWLKDVSSKTRLINSAQLIHWNIDKKYLTELSEKGVRIVPTEFILKNSSVKFDDLFVKFGWVEVVLKPAIGAGGRNTFRIKPEEAKEFNAYFAELIQQEDYMIQPFQRSVPEVGEWSYMIFGDEYSHAVVKKAKKGEFRVQDDFGGKVTLHNAAQKEIDFALEAKAACPGHSVYTRVDAVVDNEGKLAVSEIELIEPELWFRLKPDAADLLAAEVQKQLDSANS